MERDRTRSRPRKAGCIWLMGFADVLPDCVMTSLEDPTKTIAEPGGYLLAPIDEERIGDVSNVLFSNGWIADEDGTVYIYYASSDTRMHVATSTIDRLIDYCFHTPADGLRSAASVENICNLIEANKAVTVETEQVYL